MSAATGSLGMKLRRMVSSDHPLPWLMPMLAMLLVFTIYPLIYNIWLSFHEYAPFKRKLVPVGWENWQALFNDERFIESLAVTFTYVFVVLAIELVLGMLLALLLDSDDPGFGFLRAILTLTLVVPPAITGMMFLLLEDPEFGVLSYALELVGLIDSTTPILATSSTALAGVMLADIWQWTPFMVLIFLAGLRSLPPEPYEAGDARRRVQCPDIPPHHAAADVEGDRGGGADTRHRSVSGCSTTCSS